MTNPPPPKRSGPRDKWWLPVIGSLLGVVFLGIVAYGVDWAETIGHLQAVEWHQLVIVLLIAQASFLIRTFRWVYIMPKDFKVSFGQGYRMLMLGHMGNLVLPARLGELARAALVRRGGMGDTSLYIGTIAAEHVLDLFVLLAVAGILLLGLEWQVFAVAKILALLFTLTLFLFLFRLVFFSPWGRRVLKRIESSDDVFGQLAVKILSKVKLGMQVLFERRLLAVALLQTMAIWTCSALVVFTLGSSVIPGFELPWAFAVSIGIALSIALPAAPAYIGAYEFGVVFVLGYFGVVREQGLAVALLLHTMLVVGVLLAGSIAFAPWIAGRLVRLVTGRRETPEAEEEEEGT